MTRSPLSYPLNRAADMDAGGAGDLQTDIMRFMAILSLCLVAIFALVQSIPMTPAEPVPAKPAPVAAEPVPAEETPAVVQKPAAPEPAAMPATKPVTPSATRRATKPAEKAVTLTRPKWVPRYQPAQATATAEEPAPDVRAAAPADQPVAPEVAPEVAPAAETEAEGFTLRFESDAALTRLVAASRVGLYAIEGNRARRMAVSNSRISFWDASTPNRFHEMETATVPAPVISALGSTGTSLDGISWGVTLPGKLTRQLDDLMQNHRGGALVIAASGDIRWEAT